MVASSVPVRKDVPNIKEDLDAAGIRFVYFSGKLSEINLYSLQISFRYTVQYIAILPQVCCVSFLIQS